MQEHEKCYYVYMMTNTHLNVLYTGVTNDLLRRVFEHKSNIKKCFTQKYNINKLVYFELFSEITLAIMREKQIKSWNRKRKNQLIDSFNPRWEDLYQSLI